MLTIFGSTYGDKTFTLYKQKYFVEGQKKFSGVFTQNYKKKLGF